MGREPKRLPITCVRTDLRFLASEPPGGDGSVVLLKQESRNAAKCRGDTEATDLTWEFAFLSVVQRELLRISSGSASRHFDCVIENGKPIRLRLLGFESDSRPGLLVSEFTWRPDD